MWSGVRNWIFLAEYVPIISALWRLRQALNSRLAWAVLWGTVWVTYWDPVSKEQNINQWEGKTQNKTKKTTLVQICFHPIKRSILWNNHVASTVVHTFNPSPWEIGKPVKQEGQPGLTKKPCLHWWVDSVNPTLEQSWIICGPPLPQSPL